MITLTFYGLDQFVVGRISGEISDKVAKLFEIDEDEVDFIAPENMVFHKGVEQTSWNTKVIVHAPEKYKDLKIQRQVAELLLEEVSIYSINVAVEFSYYDLGMYYTKFNDEYPRFITEDNIVNIEEDEEFDEEGDGDIYNGDIFAPYFEK